MPNNDGGRARVCVQAVENVCSLMIVERPGSIEDCVYWARRQFEDRFSNDIKQLLHIHPLDKLGDDGKLFWSGVQARRHYPPAPPPHGGGGETVSVQILPHVF